MAALLDEAMDEGAWGLSTSFLDVDQHGRPVPSRLADGAEFDALLDVLARAGRGVVEVVPGPARPRPPRPTLRRPRRRAAARAASRSRGPASSTSTAHPAVTQRWIDLAAELAAEGVAHLPAALAAHRRLPAELGLVDDVHVDARGLAPGDRGPRRRQGRAARATRSGAPPPATSGTARERAMFPHRRPDKVRFVEVFGAENERWLGRTLRRRSSPSSGGHPSDVLADFVLANDCRPGRRRAVGIANADVEGVAPHARRPRRADQLVRRRRPRADAVRVGRHDAAAHPPRPRPRRLHARARGARAHRPPGRGLRLPPAGA